uniref:Tudor domain-containing protein n=1 Tax=Scleropages formosus TaxID=113540 RepID=A0A8C9SF18_SCLFO
MAECCGDIVYRSDERGVTVSQALADDDAALVKAYEKALKSFQGTKTADKPKQTEDGKKEDFLESEDHGKEPDDCKMMTQHQWAVGSRCLAKWSETGLLYPAVLLWIKGQHCRVKFEGYGNEEEIDLSELLPENLEQPSGDQQWTLGSRCRAVWSDDGLVYPAVLVWAEGQRGRVLFDVYGNEEELELSALLPPEEQEPSVSTVTEVTTISIVFNRQLRPLNHKLIPFLPFCSRKFTLVKHHMVLCPLSLLARLCSGTWMAAAAQVGGSWRSRRYLLIKRTPPVALCPVALMIQVEVKTVNAVTSRKSRRAQRRQATGEAARWDLRPHFAHLQSCRLPRPQRGTSHSRHPLLSYHHDAMEMRAAVAQTQMLLNSPACCFLGTSVATTLATTWLGNMLALPAPHSLLCKTFVYICSVLFAFQALQQTNSSHEKTKKKYKTNFKYRNGKP